MSKVFLSLGSNKGNRLKNLELCLKKIDDLKGTNVLDKSSIFLTEPYKVMDSIEFFNQVILIETSLSPDELHNELLRIEKELGRTEKGNFGPREIDIDILFYDDLILDTEKLRIPHYDLHNRKFILVPFCEIDPEFIHPEFKLSINSLLNNLSDNPKITKLN